MVVQYPVSTELARLQADTFDYKYYHGAGSYQYWFHTNSDYHTRRLFLPQSSAKLSFLCRRFQWVLTRLRPSVPRQHYLCLLKGWDDGLSCFGSLRSALRSRCKKWGHRTLILTDPSLCPCGGDCGKCREVK